jgi:amino acid transporter
VDVARDLGGASFLGTALGAATMAGALVSSLALYSAYLASGARTTLVMAQRGHLPAVFARVHGRFGTPYGSIVIAAVLHAILATGSFAFLIVIDVLLFVLSYLLIFVAAVVLRVKEPGLARPFRVATGSAGMIAVAGVPTLVALAVLVASGPATLAWGTLAAATGPVAYRLSTRLTRDPRSTAPASSVAGDTPAP